MTVCLDSSVALKWVLPEDDSDQAEELLDRWRGSGETLVAPAHFFVEVASVLRQRTLRVGEDHLDLSDAHGALAALLGAGVTIQELSSLHLRALDLAAELAQSTTYDTHYLALAESEGCEFWTADERLYRTARIRFPWVRWLGEVVVDRQ